MIKCYNHEWLCFNIYRFNIHRLRLTNQILNIGCCIKDIYYENKITLEKYCEDCFTLNLNQNPSNFDKVSTHRARLFPYDPEIFCFNCNHSVTKIAQTLCCNICFEIVSDFLESRDLYILTTIVLNSEGDPTIIFIDYRREPAVNIDWSRNLPAPRP